VRVLYYRQYKPDGNFRIPPSLTQQVIHVRLLRLRREFFDEPRLRPLGYFPEVN
jgi:hypothetical protein